jgi:hypothetical protein
MINRTVRLGVIYTEISTAAAQCAILLGPIVSHLIYVVIDIRGKIINPRKGVNKKSYHSNETSPYGET